MNVNVKENIESYWHAELLSPKDLVCRAIMIAVIFGSVHLAGLREYTSILSGTAGSAEIGRGLAAFLGVGYVFSYLAFVLLVPIFLIAALLILLWQRLGKTGKQDVVGAAKLDLQ